MRECDANSPASVVNQDKREKAEKAAKMHVHSSDMYSTIVEMQNVQQSLLTMQRSIEFTLQSSAATNSAIYAHTK
eukprot:1191332-Prorocentrum_minimum.AAC.1